jgi:hypothetical protein
LVTFVTTSDIFIFIRSANFFLFAKNENRIETPWLIIDTSRLYSDSKKRMNSSSVISPMFISKLSQAVQSHFSPFSIAVVVAGGVGSLSVINGIAKFTNPFLYASIFRSFWEDPTILYNSRQIKPVTSAVVVAMAGMILQQE